jgi:hypothetical protein
VFDICHVGAPIGSFSLREKVRMRGENSLRLGPLTLASSDYAKDKLSRRKRESLCLMPKFELNSIGEDDKESRHV